MILVRSGAACVLAAACLQPTEIKLEISTDIDCARLSEITISVGKLGDIETAPVAATAACTKGSSRVGELVLVPRNPGALDTAGVRVEAALDGKSVDACRASRHVGGCLVARRAAGYVPHTPLTLPISLSSSCIDVPCEAMKTCVNGQCVPALCDPRKGDCAVSDGGAPPPPPPPPAYERSFGGQGPNKVISLAVDPSDNVYVVGDVYPQADLGSGPRPSQADVRAFIAAYDPTLAHRWSQLFEGAQQRPIVEQVRVGPTRVSAVGRTYAGTFTVGSTMVGGVQSQSGFVVKLDLDGMPLTVSFSGTDLTSVAAVRNTEDIWISGQCDAGMVGPTICAPGLRFYVHLGASQQTVSSLSVTGSNLELRAALPSDTNVLLAGGSQGAMFSNGDAITSSANRLPFVALFPPTGPANIHAVLMSSATATVVDAAVSTNRIALLGSVNGALTWEQTFASPGPGQTAAFVKITDKSLAPMGGYTFTSSNSVLPASISQDAQGNFFVCGSFSGAAKFGSAAGLGVWVAALDANGQLLGAKSYGGIGSDACAAIAASSQPGYAYIGGSFSSPSITFDGPPLPRSSGPIDGFIARVKIF